MNKKLIAGYLGAGMFFSFTFASSISAFWPFDALVKKSGEVKAVSVDKLMPTNPGIVDQRNSKAYMTYQTLVSMNDACRKMFSKDYPTPTKVVPTSTANVRGDSKRYPNGQEVTQNAVYVTEFAIDKKSETELNSIYNNLKSRCENIANLVTRMQKIYKGDSKPVLTPTPTVVGEVMEVKPTTTPTPKKFFNIEIKERQNSNLR